MPDHVYRIIEIAGSSEKSIEDAIQNAVVRASRTLRQVDWFEVVETRGHIKTARWRITRSLSSRVHARGRRLARGHSTRESRVCFGPISQPLSYSRAPKNCTAATRSAGQPV